MKRTFLETIGYRIKTVVYYVCHPVFTYKYSKRYNNSFSQQDLEYCVTNIYRLRLGKKLDLNNAKTFNEKMNWLKCFYHDDRMTECADKETAPDFFKRKTGLDDNYIVKRMGVYSNLDEIDFSILPSSFVLKLNCGSSKQIIVEDKSKMSVAKINSELRCWINRKSNHYYNFFEYSYKNITPKIICEEFITYDYKLEFFCFNGKPIYFWTIFNDHTDDECADFYNAQTKEKINLRHGCPNSGKSIDIPSYYNDMYRIAGDLSKDFPFVRIDFYKTSDSFKFSEMTFYHWGGIMPFDPEWMDFEFGENLVLPNKII